MIKLNGLTGALLLLISCNSLQGTGSRMDDCAYKKAQYEKAKQAYEESEAWKKADTAAFLNQISKLNGASNDRQGSRDCPVLTAGPSEWERIEGAERARERAERERNERRGEAMLEAYACGDVVSREGDVTGCTIL